MEPGQRQARTMLFGLTVLVIVAIWIGLHPKHASQPILDEPLPEFHLVNLMQPQHYLTNQDLQGQVTLLHVWASWCALCRMEMPLLLRIAKDYHVPIYALNYEDGSDAARAWLRTYGNPYRAIGQDSTGAVGRSLGVFGTPETFLLDQEGNIRYQHTGVLTTSDWEQVLWPLVQTYRPHTAK